MIEFFVERVRSEKVGNGAGAGASKMGRGICGFSIPPPVLRTGDGWDRIRCYQGIKFVEEEQLEIY